MVGASGTSSGAPGDAQVRADTTPSKRQGLDVASLGFNRGSPDAPIRVLEMSDYGCGYCRKFHMETWPVLRKQFVETGKVQWKFLPFVAGMFRNSPHATAAAACALEQGPEAFEAMNERLWAEQKAWKNSSDADGVIAGWIGELGLDAQRYQSCMGSDRPARQMVAAGAASRQLGVRGTPTFFITGYPPVPGALPTEVFQQLLERVYDEAAKKAGG